MAVFFRLHIAYRVQTGHPSAPLPWRLSLSGRTKGPLVEIQKWRMTYRVMQTEMLRAEGHPCTIAELRIGTPSGENENRLLQG